MTMGGDKPSPYENADEVNSPSGDGGRGTGTRVCWAQETGAMTVKVSVKSRFVFNGKEYGSLEELPERVREAYRKAATGAPSGIAGVPGGGARVVFNGVGYESVDAMPAEERAVYEGALAMARGGHLTPAAGAVGSGGAVAAGPDGVPVQVVSAAPIEPGGAAGGRRAPVALVLGLMILLMVLGFYLYTAVAPK